MPVRRRSGAHQGGRSAPHLRHLLRKAHAASPQGVAHGRAHVAAPRAARARRPPVASPRGGYNRAAALTTPCTLHLALDGTCCLEPDLIGFGPLPLALGLRATVRDVPRLSCWLPESLRGWRLGLRGHSCVLSGQDNCLDLRDCPQASQGRSAATNSKRTHSRHTFGGWPLLSNSERPVLLSRTKQQRGNLKGLDLKRGQTRTPKSCFWLWDSTGDP